MARDFFPFVENESPDGKGRTPYTPISRVADLQSKISQKSQDTSEDSINIHEQSFIPRDVSRDVSHDASRETFENKQCATNDTHKTSDKINQLQPKHTARIAIYDDAATAPRVLLIEPKDVRTYLEEITSAVNKHAREQGGIIPFMVIREIVENFIHAYFESPTISILDNGNTIRFSDQGPGIKTKQSALEYGTSSATEEMKRYIRGVGSGLPYVQQYMNDKGGSLEIEDNISGGTIVTISTKSLQDARCISRVTQKGCGGGDTQTRGQISFTHQIPINPQTSHYEAQAFVQTPYGQSPYNQTIDPTPYPSEQNPIQIPLQGHLCTYSQSPSAPYVQPQTYQQHTHLSQIKPQDSQLTYPNVSERGVQIMTLLSAQKSCGPTELVRQFGSSGPTWSRELGKLAQAGFIIKDGQKYHLTEFGDAWTQNLFS